MTAMAPGRWARRPGGNLADSPTGYHRARPGRQYRHRTWIQTHRSHQLRCM